MALHSVRIKEINEAKFAMMRRWDYNLRGPIDQDLTKRYVPQPIGAPLPPKKPLKAVVMVAGKGTRLRPLTDTTPKPLLPLYQHPILEYILDGIALTGIREIALIVGYKAEMFKDWIGTKYLANRGKVPCRANLKIDFIFQENVNGTGGALLLAKDWIGSAYAFVTYGDILMSWTVYSQMVDIFQKNNLKWFLVGNITSDPSSGAAIYYTDHLITGFIEKPPKTAPPTDLNNAGCYIFPPEIFALLAKTPLSPRGEVELTWPIIERVNQKLSPYLIKMTPEEFWCDVGTVPVYEQLQKDPTWVTRVKNIALPTKPQ
jgi:UDP-N-acetylglucosamine diphosphorylase / glucose-1-phosphate thymidylyltransferase / UDP-N-acetylgalactosamine diphosphorylase / glucosamine-1-phosphate N-acetyltransferase / galactosamine-1-phosphate N-acetyltransferase